MKNPNVDMSPEKLYIKQCYDLLHLISIEGRQLSDVSFKLGELVDSGYDSLSDSQKETIAEQTVILNNLITDIDFYFSRFKLISGFIQNGLGESTKS